MRFGVHFMDFNLPGGPEAIASAVAGTARAAEQAGASWFTVMDHWFQMEQFRTAHDPMLEAYTTLGFAAAVTTTVRLGTVVTGVTYRPPGLLAKTVSTLDVLSGGRAFLGIGAAWYEREHRALGVPYPPVAERFERLEEALQVALQMWGDDEGPYRGTHYELEETISVPATVSRPRPGVVVGGSGERKTLRLVARYADACNLIVPDADAARHKLEVLARHCETEGTDYDAIEKTAMGGMQDPLADVDAFLRGAQEFADAGIAHLHLRAVTPDPVTWAQRFGEEVAPRLAEVG